MNHEKEIYEMCVDKIKESMKLRNEVNQIVPTCGADPYLTWQIHGWVNFKQVADVLNLGHYKCVLDWGEYTKVYFVYAGVHVFALIHPADKARAEAIRHADKVS